MNYKYDNMIGLMCLKELMLIKQRHQFFLKYKHLIDIDQVDIDRIVISSKNSFAKNGSFKCFIGYITSYIKSLCIKLPQMNGYVYYFDKTYEFFSSW